MNLPATAALCLTLSTLCSMGAAQEPAQTAVVQQPDELSAQQSLDFTQARADFNAGRWSEAMSVFRELHEKHPRNALVAKFAADDAMNLGDNAYAEAAARSVLATDADDWQAHALLVRSDAQQGNAAARDAEIATLLKLHANTTNPQFRQLTQFLAERITLPAGRLDIFYSLVPWSRYNIYEMARQYDSGGKQVLRITLESADFDQPLWAKSHAKEAAAGERSFSMDGYRDDTQADGRVTQTHMTFRFFDGRPTYDAVRAQMLAIASGKQSPATSSSGIVPK